MVLNLGKTRKQSASSGSTSQRGQFEWRGKGIKRVLANVASVATVPGSRYCAIVWARYCSRSIGNNGCPRLAWKEESWVGWWGVGSTCSRDTAEGISNLIISTGFVEERRAIFFEKDAPSHNALGGEAREAMSEITMVWCG